MTKVILFGSIGAGENTKYEGADKGVDEKLVNR